MSATPFERLHAGRLCLCYQREVQGGDDGVHVVVVQHRDEPDTQRFRQILCRRRGRRRAEREHLLYRERATGSDCANRDTLQGDGEIA